MNFHNLYTGYPRHRENRDNGQKNSLSGKTQGIWKFCQNTGNFVKTQGTFFCSSSKCSDSKSKGHCDIYRKKKTFFPLRSWIDLPIQFCVCNSHKLCKLAQGKFAVRQGKYRENTRNLKIQFEWVPCISYSQKLNLSLISHTLDYFDDCINPDQTHYRLITNIKIAPFTNHGLHIIFL